MLKKIKISVLLTLLSINNNFAEVSNKELIKGVFFGAGPVAKKVDYIKKSYSLNGKLSGSDLIEAEVITDKLTAKIIEKHPRFAKDFTAAVNQGNLTEVLHHVEQADTILTSLYDEETYNPEATGVAVVAVAVVAVAVHNAVAVTSVAVAAVAAAVKLALMTTNDEDSLLHREKLAMELSRGFQK